MATTANGIGDYSAAFEKLIQPMIQDNIPDQVKLLKVLKTNDNVERINNNFFVTIRSSRHGGVGNIANDKAKLNSGGAVLSQGTLAPIYLTGAFDISDVAIKASATRRQALESDLLFQAKAIVKDFSKQANRQYFSDGVGVIAMVSESSGSVGAGTVQIQYPNGNMTTDGRATAYYGTTNGGINGDVLPWAKYFAPGNIVGFGSAGTAQGTIAGSAQAVSGGTSLGTLILTATTPFPASAPVYFLDGDVNAAGTSEIQGFRSALSEGTGNYMGLPRATATWQPQFSGTAQNQSISIPAMEQLYLTAYEYASPGDRYAWFVNKSLYTRFGDLLTSLRRTVNKTELVSGWSGYSFEVGQGNVPVIMDYDCPDGEAILVNLDTWTVCEIAPMGFVQDELLRRADYITFQKVFTWYTNLACRAPAANGRMVRQTR